MDVPQWMTYEYVERLRAERGLRDNWEDETDERLLRQYEEKDFDLEEELRESHFQSLAESTRNAFESDSEDDLDRFAGKLEQELIQRGIDYVKAAHVGMYHGGEMVITIVLKTDPGREKANRDLPYYYEGFRCHFFVDTQGEQ